MDDGSAWACYRVTSGENIIEQTDRNGDVYGLFALDDTAPRPVATIAPTAQAPRASNETLHRVYSAMFDALSLTKAHRDDLHKRGLSDDAIARHGLKSMGMDERRKVVEFITNAFPDVDLCTIPGFYRKDNHFRLGGMSGLWVPVRNLSGQTVGVRIRLDEPDSSDKRHQFLSSNSYNGPGPQLQTHIPVWSGSTECVRITEGELKANVTTELSNVLTLGIPGVSNCHNHAADCLQKLGAKRVLVAFDADQVTKHNVSASLERLVKHLESTGFSVSVEHWELQHGKGIDDVYALNNQGKIKVIETSTQKETETMSTNTKTTGATMRNVSGKTQTNQGINIKQVFTLGSDSEVATHVIKELQRQFDRIEYDRNALWGYTNGIYREIQQPFIEQIVASYDGYGIGSEETAPDELKPFRANYSRMQGVYQCLLSTTKNKAIARDYEEMLNHGSERYFEPGFFNNAASGIPFRNGFVRLNPTTHEVEVLPHSTEHRALFALPFDYTPGVDTPLWNKYLCDVWNNYDSAEQASRVYFLEEWIGATLLGDITKHALCVLWVGSGSNGKSVGLETISGLFHAETICSVAPQRWNNPFELVRLAGKKLNVCEETPNVKIAGPDIFKAVTSGSPVEACKKHQDFYRFKPTAGHIFALNTLHGTNDHSEGYWRRLAPLAFDRKFDAKTADVDFGRKLAKETPGIAALVVEAASRLAKRGHFNIPQSVSEYKEAWRAETNQYLQFIGERWNDLSEQHGESIPGKVLYSAFYEWSKSNGHREPPGNNTFSNELERLGYKKVRRNTGVIWYKQ